MRKINLLLGGLVMSLLCVNSNVGKISIERKNVSYNTSDTQLDIDYNEDCYEEESTYCRTTTTNYVKRGSKNIAKYTVFTNALKMKPTSDGGVVQNSNGAYDYYFILSCVTVTPLWNGNLVGVPNSLTVNLTQDSYVADEKIETVIPASYDIAANTAEIDVNTHTLSNYIGCTNERASIYKKYAYNTISNSSIDAYDYFKSSYGTCTKHSFDYNYTFDFGNIKPKDNAATTSSYDFYTLFLVKNTNVSFYNLSLTASLEVREVNKSWACNNIFVSKYSSSSTTSLCNKEYWQDIIDNM